MSYPVVKRYVNEDPFLYYSGERNKKRNFNGREVNQSLNQLFLSLPTEVFIKIFSLVSLEDAYFFSRTCATNWNIASKNIKIIYENIFSNYFKKFQPQKNSEEVISNLEKIKQKFEPASSEFSELHAELFNIRFEMVNFLSSNIALNELKILTDNSHFTDPFRLSELAWLVRGLKLCFGFIKKSNGEFDSNSVKNWFFEVRRRCQVEEMKIVVIHCVEMYSKMSQSNTKGNDTHVLHSIDKILFSSYVADENLRLLFSEILVNGSVSYLADLFKIVGQVLLNHPLLDGNDNTCLPSCILNLAHSGGKEKLKNYIEKNKKLTPHVHDIFTIAILFDEFFQCFKEKKPTSLHQLLSNFLKNTCVLKLNCNALRNKTISCLISNLLIKCLPIEIKKILWDMATLVNTVTERKLRNNLINKLIPFQN